MSSKRLAGLVGSDSEPDFHVPSAPARAVSAPSRSMAPVKRGRGRPPAANKVTKPAQRTVDRPEGAATRPRKVLTDRSNVNILRGPKSPEKDVADASEVGQSRREGSQLNLTEESQIRQKSFSETSFMGSNRSGGSPIRSKRRRSAIKSAALPREVPEARELDAMDVDTDSDPVASLDEQILPSPEKDSEELFLNRDSSDVALRRRLGELTRKYENMEARYKDLRDVGIKEAERNYERLRKQAEDSTNVSNKLIAQLRDEIAAQSALVKEGDKLRQDLERNEAHADNMQDKITDLNRSLVEARSEIKTLSTKLAAARNAQAGVKVPGSAVKAGSGNNRGTPSEVVQAAQAKEDLYGDLTGLIVRGLKRGDQEDVFDCIQTGRNGTLHFKLAVEPTDAATSYEEVQFTYRPQLDADRDGDLMDVLPDYLVEEITFLRPQASKFYSRVIKSLTERLE